MVVAKTAREERRATVVRMLTQGFSVVKIFEVLQPIGYHRSFVYRTARRWREEGTISDHKRSGRPRTVRTKSFVKKVAMRMRRSAARSVRRLAQQLSTAISTTRLCVNVDLGLSPYKRRRVQHIPLRGLAKRLKRSRGLLHRHDLGHVLFSDEKKWTVEEKTNPQNHRIYAASIEDAQRCQKYYVTSAQAPAHVMVWATISNQGKFAIRFLPDERLTATKYRDLVLKPHLQELAESHFESESWTFQQDGAPCHRAKIVQEWLTSHVTSFIDADSWPPYSPDLNPCDYYLWGRLGDLVNTKRFSSVESLKAAITAAWEELDNGEVAAACAGFRDRLKKCVQAKGGQFEV
jgi:transposase